MIEDGTVEWRPEARGEHRTNHTTRYRPSNSLLCRGRLQAPYRSEQWFTLCLVSTREGDIGMP